MLTSFRENINTPRFLLSDMQSSTHSMELIIIALIAVEVIIVRLFRLALNLILLIEQDWIL